MPVLNKKRLNTADGSSLFIRDWPAAPSGPWKGTLLIMHGLGEHVGRYENFARFCNESGYTVRGYDHRGHGASSGKRGDIPHPLALLEDAKLIIEDFSREWGIEPVLFGHSMGGLFAARIATARLAPIRGLILSSPALAINLRNHEKLLLYLLKRTFPHLGVPNNLPLSRLSHDSKVIGAYKTDALAHNKISSSLLQDMLDSMDFCHTNAFQVESSVLMQIAGEDHLVDMQGSLNFYSRLPQKKVTLFIYRTLYHEIYNEIDAATVYRDLENWLQKLPKI